jgi:hypothetical protein
MREPNCWTRSWKPIVGVMLLGAVGCSSDGTNLPLDASVPGVDVPIGLDFVSPPPGRDLVGPDPECKPEGQACEAFSECCSGECAEQLCTACRGVDAECSGNRDCCVGLTCAGDDTTGRSCSDCQPGRACQTAAQCCDGQDCLGGQCQAVCADDGADCVLASDCCSNICDRGTCQACDQSFCSADGDCCPGVPCTSGACCLPIAAGCGGDSPARCCDQSRCGARDDDPAERCCRPIGMGIGWTECGSDAECCDAALCQNGNCCNPLGRACDVDSNCCEGTCQNGICCNAIGEACSDGGQCCADFTGATPACSAAGTCCADRHAICTGDAECCPGLLCNPTIGWCCDPTEESSCKMDSDCCPGQACDAGTCRAL